MKTQIWVPEYEPPDTLDSEMSRRYFLKFGMSSFLGLVAMQHLQSTALAQIEKMVPRAKQCIVLFMNGGPSQLDTFDPKPGTLNAGAFSAIPTSAEGIQFSQHLPLVAEQAHRLAVIRSMVSREGNHERARYLLHTGYAPTGSVKHSTFGSLASHYLYRISLPHSVSPWESIITTRTTRVRDDRFASSTTVALLMNCLSDEVCHSAPAECNVCRIGCARLENQVGSS